MSIEGNVSIEDGPLKGGKVRINFIPDTSIIISYRQWLAGLAMQGILASCPKGMNTDKLPFDAWAKSAVKQADELIKQLEKSNGTM